MTENIPAAPAEPLTETETADLEALEEGAPRVGIIMGSKSDMETMEKAGKVLDEAGVINEIRVMSAHRDPEMVAEYCKNARMRGLRVSVDGAVVTAGGRVLNVTALAGDAAAARAAAYAAADRITFEGRQLRRDIALRAVERAA